MRNVKDTQNNCMVLLVFCPLTTELGTWQLPAPIQPLQSCNKVPACVDRVETARYC